MELPTNYKVTVTLNGAQARAVIDAIDLTGETPRGDLGDGTLLLIEALHQAETLYDIQERALRRIGVKDRS